MIVNRSFQYRLNPTKAQRRTLEKIREEQRQLYNAALQERIDCYRKTGKSLSFFSQSHSLTLLRKDEDYRQVPVSLQRWTLKKLDQAYRNFFRKGGYPRFRGHGRWRSFGFSQYCGFSVVGHRLSMKGVCGAIRMNLHRPIDGVITGCVIGEDTKGWVVTFQTKREAIPAANDQKIGVDVGLSSFATLSEGTKIPNPRIAKSSHRKVRQKQRALARGKRGSKRRAKRRIELQRAHKKIVNARQTFLHQQSAKIVRDYGLIAVEDLKIRNMVKNPNLARSISDAGWGKFIEYLTYKAESAGGKVIKVNPKNTSQACSGCGQIVPKGLSERIHSCECGTYLDRDHNAALNILSLAVMGQEKANVTEYRKRPSRNIKREAA